MRGRLSLVLNTSVFFQTLATWLSTCPVNLCGKEGAASLAKQLWYQATPSSRVYRNRERCLTCWLLSPPTLQRSEEVDRHTAPLSERDWKYLKHSSDLSGLRCISYRQDRNKSVFNVYEKMLEVSRALWKCFGRPERIFLTIPAGLKKFLSCRANPASEVCQAIPYFQSLFQSSASVSMSFSAGKPQLWVGSIVNTATTTISTAFWAKQPKRCLYFMCLN